MINKRDVTHLTSHTGLLVGAGMMATFGAFLLYEAGEYMMGYRSSIIVRRPILFASSMQGGQRHSHNNKKH